MNDFLTYWNETDRKAAIVQELTEQGILLHDFLNAVDRNADLFDLICHVAFDQKPLTRRERANDVKKRNYFGKYSEKAQAVLEALLEKYADEGVTNIEDVKVLQIKPFDRIGSPVEIVKLFGGKMQYMKAVHELEEEIYRTTA